MRIIAATRLSRLDEATASPEAQAESLREYANRNGHTIIAETSDLDVSGGKPIRQRPDVGQWLTAEHLDDWDAIAGYSVDRMFRNLYDFVTFWHDFLEPNGKGIIIVSENIDMSTPDGRMMAGIRVMMAENELNKITKRNKDSAEFYRVKGWWHGGQISFGYKPKRQGSHFILVIDEDTAEVARQIAADVISGHSLGSIARDLTRRQIPTGWTRKGEANTHWSAGPLARMLRSKALIGFHPYNFRPDGSYELARNEDGELHRREPVLDDSTWEQLQAALERPVQRSGRRMDSSLLSGIAFCGNCKAKLHANTFTSRGKAYRYYVCAAECGAKSISMEKLNADVSEFMACDETPEVAEVTIKGENHDAELEGIQESQANLLAVQDDIAEDEFDRRMAELRQERKRLLKLNENATPPTVFEAATGFTYAQRWLALDTDQQRRKLLADRSVMFLATRDALHVMLGSDLDSASLAL